MSEETHNLSEVKKTEFTDRKGKKRIWDTPVYQRSDEHQEEMEKYRLGPFAGEDPTADTRILKVLRTNHQVFIAPYPVARTITATRLLRESKSHKLLTGSDLLADYLSDDTSQSLHEGFPQFHQLFLFFGYTEAKNRRLPQIVVQLMGQRFHKGMHSWLFFPDSLARMEEKWGDFKALSYINQLEIPKLSDHDEVAGPRIEGFRNDEVVPQTLQNDQNDRKLQQKKKRK